MSFAENKSEGKDIKTSVSDIKIDFLSSVFGKTINFVRICINIAKCNTVISMTRIWSYQFQSAAYGDIRQDCGTPRSRY